MKTTLRLFFNPVDNIFPKDYRGPDFFDIIDPAYIPNNGTKVYFDTVQFTSDLLIANKINDFMDNDGLQLSIWRVDYQADQTIISGSLTSSGNYNP